MMMDWNEYRKQVGAAITDMAKISPDTVRGYSLISGAAGKAGHLDAKTREMIALAVASDAPVRWLHYRARRCSGEGRRHARGDHGCAERRGGHECRAALVFSARVLDAFAARTATPAA